MDQDKRNIYADATVAEAWSIVSDELVAILREGGHTAWATRFLGGN